LVLDLRIGTGLRRGDTEFAERCGPPYPPIPFIPTPKFLRYPPPDISTMAAGRDEPPWGV